MIYFLVCTGPVQQNGLNPTNTEIQKLQTKIQQLEYSVKAMSTVSLAVASAMNAKITESGFSSQEALSSKCSCYKDNAIFHLLMLIKYVFWLFYG